MATKRPKSTATLLKEALKENEELKKKLASVESTKASYERQTQEYEKELQSVHAALNALPGIPQEAKNLNGYGTMRLTVTARLFAWLAQAQFQGPPSGRKEKDPE